MFRHLLKLIWKRKSRNLMLSLEILLAFMVVFAVAAFGVRSYQLYHMPTGFEHQDLWSADIEVSNDSPDKIDVAVYDTLRRSLLAMPEVTSVAFATFSPYRDSTWSGEFSLPDGSRKMSSNLLSVTDDYFHTAGMKLAEGRWFSSVDDGSADIPVVINRRMAADLFPGKSAIGQRYVETENSSKRHSSYKVTGVIEEFRDHGELMAPKDFALQRFAPATSKDRVLSILLKVRPGTPRTFEATLNRQLKLVRSDWGYMISPVADLRASQLRLSMMPLTILAIIAAFLLLMVFFGLFGVLWQNTTQRIPEIGLRRALGADTGAIYRQIVAEQMLLSSGAMLVALVLLVQLPITGVMGDALGWPVFAAAAALSMALIYLLSLLCSLYPGWRASRLSPTEALHYE